MILIGFRAQRKRRAKNVQIPVVLTLRADYEASVTVIKNNPNSVWSGQMPQLPP